LPVGLPFLDGAAGHDLSPGGLLLLGDGFGSGLAGADGSLTAASSFAAAARDKASHLLPELLLSGPSEASAQAYAAALFLSDGSPGGAGGGARGTAGYVQGSGGGEPGGVVGASGASQRFLPHASDEHFGRHKNNGWPADDDADPAARAAAWERLGLDSGPGPVGGAAGPEEAALWERMAAAAEPRERKSRR
jgi:hypothetical protein